MTDVIATAKADAQDVFSRIEALYKGLKAKKSPPRWLLSSKFFVAFGTIISIWLLGDKLAAVCWPVAIVASVFMLARAYTEVGQAKVADAREARLMDLLASGKASPEETAALNRLLGG